MSLLENIQPAVKKETKKAPVKKVATKTTKTAKKEA